jgi:hypothetical protein
MHTMALNKPPNRGGEIIKKEEAIVKFEVKNLGVLNTHRFIKIRSLVESLNIVGSLKG